MSDPSDHPVLAGLQRHGVPAVWHYSAAGNLPSILRHGGLYCRHERRQRGIQPVAEHGWGGRAEQLTDYLCCCLQPPRGLLRHSQLDQVALEIDPAVCTHPETLYIPCNSARACIPVEEVLARVGIEALEALFAGTRGARLRNSESEVLVYRSIRLADVRTVVFPSRWLQRKVARQCLGAGLIGTALGLRRPPWRVDDGQCFP